MLVKDLTPVKMMLCTHGSPLHRTTIPAKNHPMIDTLEEHGGIVYGKSNTPEFGAGSQTFNSLFGVTATPHDITKTAGGSRCVCVCVVCVCCVCVFCLCVMCCVCVYTATPRDISRTNHILASHQWRCGSISLLSNLVASHRH